MTPGGIIVGAMLAAGVLLCVSPWLWPRVPRTEKRSMKPGLIEAVRDRLVRAGLPHVGPIAFLLIAVVVGVAAAAITGALTGVTAVAIVALLAGTWLPFGVLARRSATRRRALEAVWPDVIDHVVSAARSGVSLPDALASLATDGPRPARESFAVFSRTYRSTGSFAFAIDDVKARLADPVADRLLETLRMAREVGGRDLTAVLTDLSSYLRQEAAVRSELEARQSWVVNAARLGVAAPWIVLLLLSTRPEAAAAYNAPEGSILIVIGVVVSVIAYRIMLRIGRLPREKRWFA